jgi:hypothetical protein
MNQNPKILFECIRLLMVEVREQKHSRESLIRALITEEAKPVQFPTDEEVNARIEELISLQEVKRS